MTLILKTSPPARKRLKKKNKYHAKKTQVNGIKFDSKLESKFYIELLFRKRAGEIKSIQHQPQVYLSKAKILYKPDFFVIESNGKDYYVDVKGFQTAVFNIKVRLWRCYMNKPLIIIKKGGEAKTIRGEA